MRKICNNSWEFSYGLSVLQLSPCKPQHLEIVTEKAENVEKLVTNYEDDALKGGFQTFSRMVFVRYYLQRTIHLDVYFLRAIDPFRQFLNTSPSFTILVFSE